jgi:spermidine/putrescine transport system permease protein
MKKFASKFLGPGALSFPTWAYTLFFFVIPVVMVLIYSFGRKPDEFTTVTMDRLSLDRFSEALSGTFLKTFSVTLGISITGTILCLLIAIPFAYWLAIKVPPRRRGLLLALVMVPYWTNFLVRTLGWQIILSPDGFASTWWQGLGGQPFDILYTHAAVQIGVVYNYLPLMIMPLFVAIDTAGASLREASYDLGAGKFQTFFKVTMPLAMPGIASGCLLVFVPLTGDYVTAQVLGGANGSMVGMLIANQFNTAQNWALGSAMAVVLILCTVIVVALAAALMWGGRALYSRATRVELEGA